MVTDLDVVNRQDLMQVLVNRFDDLPTLQTPRNVRLIRHNDDPVPRSPKGLDGLRDAGHELDLLQGRDRIRVSISDHYTTYDPVAIEEHRSA
jgi:hypothetical protein